MVFSLNVIPTLFSMAVYGMIAYFMWRRREIRGAREYAVSMVFVMLTTLVIFLGFSIRNQVVALGFLKTVNLFGYGAFAISFVLMIARFTGNTVFYRWQAVACMAVVPVLTVFFNWTSHWAHYDFMIIQRNGWRIIEFKQGFWFMVAQLHIFTLSAIDLYMLVRFMGESGKKFLVSSLMLVFSSLYMYLVSFVHAFVLGSELKHINYLSYAWTVPALVGMAALYSSRSIELIPQALRAAVENARDIMFVLDARGMVAECNRAACAALGLEHGDIAGRDAATLLADWGETAAFIKNNRNGVLKLRIKAEERETTLILNVTPIKGDGGEHQGRLLVFHDVSELEERERADRRARQLQELSRGIILAQEEERSRIGRELHDDFGHKFMSLSLKIEALRKKGLVDAKDIEPIENLMSGTSEELMRIYRNLKPTVIEHLGLSAALKSLVSGIESSHDIVAEPGIDDFEKEDLAPGMAMGIFRIAQESLTNIIKHSGADTVKVELYKEEDRVCLSIEDNGKGAGPDPRSESGGMGVIGMRERAAALGGEIQITSGEMGGTRVFLCIPIRHQTEQGGAS